MEPASYLKVIQRRWVVIAVFTVLAAAAGWLTTPDDPPPVRPIKEFQAAATLLSSPAAGGPNTVPTVGTVGTLAFLSTTGEVPRRVARKIGYEGEPAVLATQVRAIADEKLHTIKFTSSGPDGPQVASLTNSFATELMAFLEERAIVIRQQQVTDALARMEALQAGVLQRDAQIATGGAGTTVDLLKAERDALIRQYSLAYDRLTQVQALPPPTSGLTLFEEATPIPIFKSTAFRPPSSHVGRTVIGVIVGVIVGMGIAFAIERLNGLLYTKEVTEDAFGLPVVAEIPLARHARGEHFSLDVVTKPSSQEAEAFRRLRASITLMRVLRPLPTEQLNGNGHHPDAVTGQPLAFVGGAPGVALESPGVILISSAGPGEGKTRACANLAASFAQTGVSVLIVDCDFGSPQVHRYFGVAQGRGVANIISNTPAGDPRTVMQTSVVPGVSVISAGTSGHAHPELTVHAQSLIAQARQLADVVIIDSSPLLGTSEPREMAPFVDAVVVLARVGRTSIKAARKTSELLGRLGAPVLGVALAGTRAEKKYSKPPGRTRKETAVSASVEAPADPTEQDVEVAARPAFGREEVRPELIVESPANGHETTTPLGPVDGNGPKPTKRLAFHAESPPAGRSWFVPPAPTSSIPSIPASPRRPPTKRTAQGPKPVEPVDE